MKVTLFALLIAACMTAPNASVAQNQFDPVLKDITGTFEISVYTQAWPGRWLTLFGTRFCAGQRFNVPGERQCV